MPVDNIALEPLIFEAVYDDGNDFWFTDYEYNALFKMNPQRKNVELVGIVPDEEFMRERLYSSITACNGKLYLAPFAAREIAEYDPEKRCFRKIPIDVPAHWACPSWENEKFFRVIAIERNIYFIPWRYPGILCYDTETDMVYCYDSWVEDAEKYRANTWGYFSEFILDNNKLVLPCSCGDVVIIFDIQTKKSQYFLMPVKQGNRCRFCGICHVDHYIYLISADGTVIKRKLESENEEIKEIALPVSEEEEIAFYPVRYMDGFIYLFPFGGGDGFRIDTKTDQAEPVGWFADENRFETGTFSYLTSISRCGKLYAAAGNSRRFVEYDFERKSKHMFCLLLSEPDRKKIVENRKRAFAGQMARECVAETTKTPVTLLLECLAEYDDFKKVFDKESKRDESMGRRFGNGAVIYDELKD